MIQQISNVLKDFYCEETLIDMATYKIKIDGTVDNAELYSLANSIASTYTKPICRIGSFNIKSKTIAAIEKPSLFVWEIVFTNKGVDFYLSISEKHKDVILNKAKSVWNRCSFQEYDRTKDIVESKYVSTGEMILKTYNFKSLNTGKDNQYPLTNMLGLSKLLTNGECVRVTIAVEPMSRINWISYAKDEKKNFDDGKIFDNEVNTTERLIKAGTNSANTLIDLWLELKFLPIESIFGIFLDDDTDLMQSNKNKKDAVKQKLLEYGDTNTSSNYKLTSQTFKTQIGIASCSNDADRATVNMLACSNAYKDLTGDNELVLFTHSEKETKKYLDSVKYFDFNIGKKCILSDKELCKMIQLPKKTLQKEYKIQAIETRETDVPKELIGGKIRVCSVEIPSKNETVTVTLPEDINALCKKTVYVGGEGSGKTTQLIRITRDFSKNKICNFVLDHQENGKLTDNMIKGLNKNDYVVYDVFNDMPALAFTEVSKLITENMDKMQRLDYANMISKQVELFVNSIVDESTGTLTGRMKRYLHSACMITFIKPNTVINDAFNVLNNWKVRNEFLRYAKYSELFDEDDDVFTDMDELHKRIDSGKEKGKIIGTRDDLIVGITNRVTLIKQNPRIKEMLKKPFNANDDFDSYIQSGKSIYIKIPQNKFPDDDTRDMLAVFYFSRLWLTVQIRNENKDSKPCHVVIDEVKSLPILSSFMEKHLTEFRRHRISMTIACHSLNQFGKMLKQLIDSGGNFVFLTPCSKESFSMLKEELMPFTYEDDILTMKPHHGLCLINYGNRYWRGIGKMPEK